MGPATYVYLTTNVDDAVELSLVRIGPRELSSAQLTANRVGKKESQRQIATISRAIDSGLYTVDFAHSIGGTYIASLQVLLRGRGLGSMIWWRWRIAARDIGTWLTDHNSHSTPVVPVRGKRYELRLTGAGTVGYDDVYVDLLTV